MAAEIATHDHPAWLDKANYIIIADLSEWGLCDRWEQLWAHRVGANEFVLCCIPFFTYGLALGDRMIVCEVDGRKHVYARVLSKSGHQVVRVWFGDADARARVEIEDSLKSHGILYEWSSSNLLAVDIPDESGISDVVHTALGNALRVWPIQIESGD